MVVFNKDDSSNFVIKLRTVDNNKIGFKYGKSRFQLMDKIMKQITNKRVNALFKRLGIPFIIKWGYPMEMVFGDILRRLDFVGETIDGDLINLEFQTTKVDDSDVERFGEYAMLLKLVYKKMVHSVVLLTPDILTEDEFMFDFNQKYNYGIVAVSLKDFNGEEIRNELIEKINNGIEFSEDDVMDFVLTPLMTIDTSIVEFIRENIYLVNKIKASEDDIQFIESMILLMINKYVQDDELNRIMKGELYMNFSIVDYIIDDIAENKSLQIADKMLKEGCSKEFILKMTSITEEQFSTLL